MIIYICYSLCRMLLNLLTFVVCNLGILWIEMVIMYLLATIKWQCQRNLYYHRVSEFFHAFIEHHYDGKFFWRDLTLEIYLLHLSFVYKSNALDKSMNSSVASICFYTYSFNDLTIVKIWKVVDWFFWKQIWFSLRIFSTPGLIWFVL